MDSLIALLALLFLAGPILAIVALIRVGSMGKQLFQLRREVRWLRAKIEADEPADQSEPQPAHQHEPTPQPEPQPEPQIEQPSAPAAKLGPASPAPKTKPKAKPKFSPPTWQIAETLRGANWLIIAGGVALSFALVFLVKYSIDEGWLGPRVRIALGLFFGALLLVAGEVARRKPLGRVLAVAKSDAFPATLTAAGVIALYASIYGAYVLYGLLPPLVTFFGLAIVSVIAVLLSFFHGPLIAALGIIGAYCVPFLVGSNEPRAETLFGYLAVVTAGAVLMARLRYWWWLGVGGLVASVLWTSLWVAEASSLDDHLILLTYWFIIGLLFPGVIAWRSQDDSPTEKLLQSPEERTSLGGTVLASLFVFLIFASNEHSSFAYLVMGLFILSQLGFAWVRQTAIPSLFAAAATGLATLLTWEFQRNWTDRNEGAEDWAYPVPLMPEGSQSIEIAALLLAGIFVILGVLRTYQKKPAVGLWASVGVIVPLCSLAIVYLRVVGLEHSLSWAMIGMASALVFLSAAKLAKDQGGSDVDNPALAAFAIGVLASFGLGMSMALERAWLTVGLALLLPAMGWVYTKLPIPKLRLVAIVTAVIVIIRLVLNQFVFDYEIARPLIFNWTLYGYGIPAIAFFIASRFYLREARDPAVNLLEAGALAFGALCLSLQARIYIHDGNLTNWSYLLSEAGVNTILWITIAYGLFRRSSEDDSPVAIIGARVFALLAIGHIGLVHVLILNPYWSGQAVGDWPLFNTLALAYAVPAILLSLFYLPWHRERLSGIFSTKSPLLGEAIFSVFAFLLGFIYITLEVTRSFHGTVLTTGPTPDAELYTYSLVWLVYAAILMGVGIWRAIPPLRLAALAIIALAAVKIFYFDMSNLAGLYRVFSFLGLALSLFGIAYLYQRFVIPPDGGAGEEEEEAGGTS